MKIKGRKELLRDEGFSEKAIKYLEEDKNVGKLESSTAVGECIGECGDKIITYLMIEDEIISDCSFLYTGCAGAGSSGSAVCELAKGMKIHDAAKLSVGDIADHLRDEAGGLPEHKLDCAEIAVGSLRDAINKL